MMAIKCDVQDSDGNWQPCIRWTERLQDGGFIQGDFPSVAIRDKLVDLWEMEFVAPELEMPETPEERIASRKEKSDRLRKAMKEDVEMVRKIIRGGK